MRAKLGSFENDHRVDMLDDQVFFVQQFFCVLQEKQAVGVFPPGIAVRKVRADIAQPCRAKQRIAKRMSEYVTIGMSCRTFIKRHYDATDHQRAAVNEAMKVVTDSAADAHAFFCSA